MSIQILDKNRSRLEQGKYVELTDMLVELPRQISIIDQLGLFEEKYVSLKKIEIQRTQYSNHLLKDKNWDAKADTMVAKPVKGFIQMSIPNFELEDAIKPHDIDGVASVDSIMEAAMLATVMDVRLEKLSAIKATFGLTEEVARMQLLMKGTAYAPNGTLATSYGDTIDYYQEMGVTRQTHDINITGSNDPRIACSQLIRKMRMALRNTPTRGNYRAIVILCGTTFFDTLYTNPFITEAVKYFQQDLNKLLLKTPDTAAGYDANFRTVTLWGLTFIDAGTGGYDDADGNFVQWIEDDKGVAIPLGIPGMFKTYFAPANTFKAINKVSKGEYYFERLNDEDNLIQMKVQKNFLNVLLYPAAIFDITFS
jgi:hypothetical protein